MTCSEAERGPHHRKFVCITARLLCRPAATRRRQLKQGRTARADRHPLCKCDAQAWWVRSRGYEKRCGSGAATWSCAAAPQSRSCWPWSPQRALLRSLQRTKWSTGLPYQAMLTVDSNCTLTGGYAGIRDAQCESAAAVIRPVCRCRTHHRPLLRARDCQRTLLLVAQPGYRAPCRWWGALDQVRPALPDGCQLSTWQLDAYADEPYCQNFRGADQAELDRQRALCAHCNQQSRHTNAVLLIALHATEKSTQRYGMVCSWVIRFIGDWCECADVASQISRSGGGGLCSRWTPLHSCRRCQQASIRATSHGRPRCRQLCWGPTMHCAYV